MLKKILLLTVFFAGNVLVAEQASKLDLEPELEFTDSRLNVIKFDKESTKSPLEQFLDAGITAGELNTPYRPTVILDGSGSHIRAIHPHRLEIPFEYAATLNAKLHNSDLLAAVVYRQIMMNSSSHSLQDAGKYGFWTYGHENCYRLNSSECQRLIGRLQLLS